ncbi:cell division protein SepF [Candidatus Pacearchaeota archaeon]|nr:cell division protein SepF [Candidatus Pacearchaeota archaeon]
MAFNFKKIFGKDESDEYVEIDLNSSEQSENKVIVKPFVMRQFDDITDVLNALRDGYTIAVIDIKTLKSKDVVELKRAIAKIKKTVDAIEGSIAGFGENVIIATPKFAQIHKTPAPKKEKSDFIN